MTRFRSKLVLIAGLLLLTGCIGRSGVPLEGGLPEPVAAVYLPLQARAYLVAEDDAGGVVLGDGIAVTVAHAEAMLPPDRIIGRSSDLDLMFFRIDRLVAGLAQAEPKAGAAIISYAQYRGAFYQATGTITALDVAVTPRCASCKPQTAFAFAGDGGPGYSGGPVLDAATGRLVGIVFGYLDQPKGGRILYAYSMAQVRREWEAIRQRNHP